MFGGSGKSKTLSSPVDVVQAGTFTWTSGFAAASEGLYPALPGSNPRFQGLEVERQARPFFFPAALAAPSLGSLFFTVQAPQRQ